MALVQQERMYANMNDIPDKLSVNCVLPEKQTIVLNCTALLRSIKGRRQVYDAAWDQRKVIAKVFTHKLSQTRHAKREWKGLTSLSRRKVNSPVPLFLGKTEEGDWVVVSEKIVDSATILNELNNTSVPEKKLELLLMVCRELAFQHKAGVLQKDFHLENFIISKGKIYTLDPGQMKFFTKEVTKNISISNLVMLLLCLSDNDSNAKKMLCAEYYKLRNWQFDSNEEQYIHIQKESQRKKVIAHGLRKCLRTSKRYIKLKKQGIAAVFTKSFCDENMAFDFIKQVDSLMAKGRILKDGNTCFVSHFEWNKNNIVVKRYNHKNLFHSLIHSFISSRARKVWLHAQRLVMLDILTPKPLAYIEQRKGFILWKSYIVTGYVEGKNLHFVLNDKSISDEQQAITMEQVEELLDRIWEFHITHGDLKHSNILITENGPALTDLDSMKAHKVSFFYKLSQAKDIERFNRKA